MSNLSAPTDFSEHLSSLKEHYEAIIAENESKVVQAKEQLAHVSALLKGSILSTTTQGKTTRPAKTPKRKSKPASAKPAKKSVRAARKQAKPKKGPSMILTPLPPYQGVSKIEAVTKVFQENSGQVLHIDDVIERLFGDLSPEEAAAEKIRMKDVMARGVRRKLWSKAPQLPLSYILKSSIETERTPRKKAKSRPPSRVTKRPASTSSGRADRLKVKAAYRNQGMSEVLVGILQNNQGRPMTADDVLPILYGKLPARDIPLAKKRLHDLFYKGVKANRWKRVPDQKGAYVLT